MSTVITDVCRKVAYPSKPAAETAIRQIRRHARRNDTGSRPVRSYRCWRCRWWHTTSEHTA